MWKKSCTYTWWRRYAGKMVISHHNSSRVHGQIIACTNTSTDSITGFTCVVLFSPKTSASPLLTSVSEMALLVVFIISLSCFWLPVCSTWCWVNWIATALWRDLCATGHLCERPSHSLLGKHTMNHKSFLFREWGWQGPVIYLAWNELDYLNGPEKAVH